MTAISLCLAAIITITNFNSVKPEITTTKTITTTTTNTGSTIVTYPPLSDFDYEVQCKLQPDAFRCDKPDRWAKRWYYDIKMEDCKEFRYFSCVSGNRNIFRTYKDCRETCRDPGRHAIENNLPANVACIMQADVGNCRDYIPMFYFDMSTRRCFGFPFTGCGGNQNRFYDPKDCQKVCAPATEKLVKDDHLQY